MSPDMATVVQVESPSSVTNTTSWASLPVEVRQMILRLVGLPISEKQSSGLGSPKVARFATVCWEWQKFFETCTFRRLVLDPDSLDKFDAIVRRQDTRLGYIRKLWLRVRLLKYECPDCDKLEDEATQCCNNMIFTTCIQSLLGTLKLWDPARHGTEGLALMLSVSSPSDTEHRFNRCEIKDSYPFHYAEDLDLAPLMVDFYRTNIADRFSRPLHRGCYPPLYNEHVKRVQGTPLRLQSQRNEQGRFISQSKSLPAVPMVKGLVMRRQFRREIHVGTLSRLLGRSFVALEWFRFERTISPEPRSQISFDKGFKLHLLPTLPKTLRQLSFTQWEIPKYERFDGLEQMRFEVSPHAQAYLPLEMAKLSLRLERFCPPWQMNTAAFLKFITELRESPEMPESSLKRIILRCSLSSSGRSSRDFGSLVILAAKAALSFPQLEVIELWGVCLDGGESRAYIFRYSHEDGRASIVWRGTEKTMVAQARIIAKWSEVAQKHLHLTLDLNVVPFAETKAEIFSSQGTCIYQHLLLKDLMFDPITQIILENESYEWSWDEQSDSSQEDDLLNSSLGDLNSIGPNLLMNDFGLDTDIASLQAELMALDSDINAFD
ncbi:hypothetical protein AK830_g7741 [Neonectria ditissima]|uniref:DUF6546 domain-containing protein n=1 Tax=Neonectria ditissima TaxID=78410 RepID=A0A0P7AZ13_9HYPO|nr:hypothetical protein AK830_g7741 [Neonectria ditissima]